MRFRNLIKPLIPTLVLDIRNLYNSTKPQATRLCSICNYEGLFKYFGRPARLDALCPNCGSLERHRLFWLWFRGEKSKLAEPVLHFAPEHILEQKFRKLYKNYKSADLFSKADLRLNIENIELESGAIKTVICNHVLEHVDDQKALSEILRILAEGGILICSVPIVEGWDKTYENNDVKTEFERELYFGQFDHIRYYGRDFRDRLKRAGFCNIEEHTAEGDAVVKYGLLRGEKFFICSRE